MQPLSLDRRCVAAGSLAILLFLVPAGLPAQFKVTIGRPKPVTMTDLDKSRNVSPVFADQNLLPKVHTVAVLTVAGPATVHLGVKGTPGDSLLDHAEKQLVAALASAGFQVQPLDQTRQTVSKEWLSTYIDAMPADDQEKLKNLSQDEKEAYIKDNMQKLCQNPLTRALFGCDTTTPGGDSAVGGGGDKLEHASTNTLFLKSMTVKPISALAAGGGPIMDDGAGQALGPVSLRVAGELAEKLNVDAIIVLTADANILNDRPANRFGMTTASQGRDFAVEMVRIQVVNPDAQFVFAECIKEVNRDALKKSTFAFSYDPDMVIQRLQSSLDVAVGKEIGHLAGKTGEK